MYSFGIVAARDLVHELEALALAQRLELDDHVRILAMPAGLADEACLDLATCA